MATPLMHDLLTEPFWQPVDLGRPIPDSPHAVSVCLPRWADNVGYEEGEPRVVDAMRSGYPRFFLHPICRELFAECRRRFAGDGEDCLAFPSQQSAEEFRQFLDSQTESAGRIEMFGERIHVVVFPQAVASTAKLGWQHLGGGISSRQAEACLEAVSGLTGGWGRSEAEPPDAANAGGSRRSTPATPQQAKRHIREQIAEHTSVSADDVYLFPSGMNAAFAIHRALRAMFPKRKSVQFGFPYVDTLKILEKVGPGTHFYSRGDADDQKEFTDLLRGESIAGLFTEFPSNPLLLSPDLDRLHALSRSHGFPLILDDTVAGFHNVDLLPVADVVWSSLTKFFSGRGDVAAGSVILNRNGPFYSSFKERFAVEYEDTLFSGDAIVLERNSRDYAERMPRINATAQSLTSFVVEHPAVESVFHPSLGDTSRYDRFRKPGGGYGGLLSVVLKDAGQSTAAFFDRLRISKGPNLGTNFSLACPFTILAHYNELDFAEACGVSRWLVRVSVGLEEADDLVGRFAEALDAVGG